MSLKEGNRHSPHKLAYSILLFVLPAAIREQVIGDLFEEFDELIQTDRSLWAAHQWFWQQSISTALLYLWNEKGGLMAFIVSILIFGAVTLMAMLVSSGLKYYLDWPSLFLVIPPAIAFGIAASSFTAYKNSLAFAFVDQIEIDEKEAKSACQFLQVTGTSAIYMGFFTSMIGWISMATNITGDDFSQTFGPAFAVSVLTIMYGMGLKILCYTAENKIRFRYL